MGYLTVTIPALLVLTQHCKFRVHRGHPVVCQYFFMTPDAVLLHNALSRLQDENHLGLCTKGENGSMTHAIFGFKVILVKCIVVWNMAIIAMGHLAVRAATPGSILWGHNMAIYAGFWLIGNI
jgi:hypothetical protein